MMDNELDFIKTIENFDLLNEDVVFYVKNLEGKIIFASQSYKKRFPNCIGSTDYDLFSKELAEAAKLDDDYVITNKKSISVLEKAFNRIDPNEQHYIKTKKIPLYDKEGNVVGIFGMSEHVTNDMEEIETYRKSVERYKNLVNTDFLTSLFNKKHFEDMIVSYFDDYLNNRFVDKSFDLFYLDFDKFKDINDTFGHDFGDKVLKTFSQTLKSVLSDLDVLFFRIGGDEFAFLSFDNREAVLKQLENINDTLIDVLDHKFYGFSVGVKNSKDAHSAEELKILTDKDLYFNKENRRKE